jgi:hypothetical protein
LYSSVRQAKSCSLFNNHNVIGHTQRLVLLTSVTNSFFDSIYIDAINSSGCIHCWIMRCWIMNLVHVRASRCLFWDISQEFALKTAKLKKKIEKS